MKPIDLLGITPEAFAAHTARDAGYPARVAESLAGTGVVDRRTLRKRLRQLGASEKQVDDALRGMRRNISRRAPYGGDRRPLGVFARAVWCGDQPRIDEQYGDERYRLKDEQFGRQAPTTRLVQLMAWHLRGTRPDATQTERIAVIKKTLDADPKLPTLTADAIAKIIKRYA